MWLGVFLWLCWWYRLYEADTCVQLNCYCWCATDKLVPEQYHEHFEVLCIVYKYTCHVPGRSKRHVRCEHDTDAFTIVVSRSYGPLA